MLQRESIPSALILLTMLSPHSNPQSSAEKQCIKRDNGTKKGKKKGFQNAGDCKRSAVTLLNLWVKRINL